MSNKQFISNLSATYADVRKLDVKKINLKGKNILEYIKESSTIILDERGTKADDELDIWNSYVTKDVNGNVIINRNAKPFEHSVDSINSTQSTTIKSAVKVIDNEVLGADDAHLMYWQTDGLMDGNYLLSGCSTLTSFNSDLSNLTNGDGMFWNCTSLSSFNADLSSLMTSRGMFDKCSNLTTFTSDLPSLTNGRYMFWDCTALSTFNSDLSSLVGGEYMFSGCTALTSFSSDLSSLTNGKTMFYNCYGLTAFNADLPKLTDGCWMFEGCSALTSFSSDLPSLTDGEEMFNSCDNLKSFNADLSSLMNGYHMFADCSKLESFNADLSSLTNGRYMFNYCKLDAQSVANIIHFIPQRDAKPTNEYDDGNIYIGIGITNTNAAKQAFAEECYCDDWEELNKEFDDKNWGVQWQFNGEASTFDLRNPRPSTAVYARLEEVVMPTEEEIAAANKNGEHIQIPHYQYTSQDGSKFYNIHWYHDSNTNNEGYDYFESLEMATLAYSVIPKA